MDSGVYCVALRGVVNKVSLVGVAERSVIKLSTKWSMGRVAYKGELITTWQARVRGRV